MMRKILLFLFILTTNAQSLETYICQGSESTYQCRIFDGQMPHLYTYHQQYSYGPLEYTFDDSGTRNPDAPKDQEPEDQTETKNSKWDDSPVFIPFAPKNFFWQ
jgi:hypothetical protein